MFLRHKNKALVNKVQSLIGSYKNVKCFATEERLKTSIFKNWGKYWKSLYLDYKDVAIDVTNDCKNRPIRALIYLSLLGTSYYFHQINPDECSFREALMQNTARLMFVSETNRNPISVTHVSHMTKCFDENVIRRLNLGIISFIWIDNYSNQCCQYKSTCAYLKPQYINFYERIVDIGFLNKWWILEEKMKEYDVNSDEFQ